MNDEDFTLNDCKAMELDCVREMLPPSYFESLAPHVRVGFMVTEWDKAVAALNEVEHERDLLRDVALRLWNEVQYPKKHRDLVVDLGFVLSMTGDRELSTASTEGPED